MTDTLSQLALREDELAGAVREAISSAHPNAPAGRWVLDEYREVHRKYVELAVAGDAEALRRAVFLHWYSEAEPAYLTGLGNLGSAASTTVLRILDITCSSSDFDPELSWATPYYFAMAEWWFRTEDAPHLSQFCRTRYSASTMCPRAEMVGAGRGLLSRYWGAIRRN